MGCDIHAHAEVKIDGIWQHYTTISISRNYALFSKMAGVRNGQDEYYIQPISEPKGLPEDVSFMTMFDYTMLWRNDAHSESWLGEEELEQLECWMNALKTDKKLFPFSYRFSDAFGFIFGKDFKVKKYLSDYPAGVQDSRIVFWFDN